MREGEERYAPTGSLMSAGLQAGIRLLPRILANRFPSDSKYLRVCQGQDLGSNAGCAATMADVASNIQAYDRIFGRAKWILEGDVVSDEEALERRQLLAVGGWLDANLKRNRWSE